MKRGESGINCLLGINKPKGMSSHDVVNHVRRALGERRVGHAGTLDPAATGVMVVGVGQATRLLGYVTLETKSYLAEIQFGVETDTDDAEGSVVAEREVPAEVADEAFARETLQGLIGESMQVPPAYSAISVDGKRSYARARSGEDVELPPRKVRIDQATLIAIDAGHSRWTCAFTVSKGTYIRSIARDLGRKIGCGAHLSQLDRTSSGCVSLAQCVGLEELEANPELWKQRRLDPVEVLGYPERRLSAMEYADVFCGRPLGALDEPEGLLSLTYEGKLVGIWERSHDTLRCKANFPSGIMGARDHE